MTTADKQVLIRRLDACTESLRLQIVAKEAENHLDRQILVRRAAWQSMRDHAANLGVQPNLMPC